MTSDPASETVHASCVTVNGRGLLIQGVSGSGKSALALTLMAFGARLVADDRTILHRHGSQIIATCPPALRGLIEARGMGILRADPVDQAVIVLVVDLDADAAQRLPEPRQCDILGLPVDLVARVHADHFAASLICLLTHGRHA